MRKLILGACLIMTISLCFADPVKDGATQTITETECETIVDCSGSGNVCYTVDSGVYPKAGACKEEPVSAALLAAN